MDPLDGAGAVPEELTAKSALIDALYQNPKTRPKLLALVKEHAPNVRIPEIDAPTEVLQALAGPLEELKKEREALRQERATERAEREHAKILGRADLGLTDEDLPAIADLMDKRGITSFETAAEFRAHAKRAAVPRTVVPSPFTMPAQDTDYVKQLLKGDKKAHLAKAYAIIEELAQSRR